MPTRLIRDGIISSEKINSLKGWESEIVFRRLMSVVDDHGRYDGRPAILRSALFPLKLDAMREANIERCLLELESAGLVRLYAVENKPYVEIINFGQRVQSKSKWPDPIEKHSESRKFTVNHGESPPKSESETKADAESNNGDEGEFVFEGEGGAGGQSQSVGEQKNCSESADGGSKPPAKSRKSDESDEEWLKSLKGNPAYHGIDVTRELGKCRAWCEAHRKECTRRRFVNWLNRVDKPIDASTKKQASGKPSTGIDYGYDKEGKPA